MDDKGRSDWRNLALMLFRRAHVDPQGRGSDFTTSGHIDNFAKAVEAIVVESGGEWDAEVRRKVMELPAAARMDRGDPTAAPLGTTCTTYMRCLRDALLLLTDKGAGIPPFERSALRAVLEASDEHGDLADRVPPTPSRIPAGRVTSATIPFAFAWKPSGRGRQPHVRGLADAGIVEVRDAPVAARLKPDGGRWFALRTVGDRLVRPVFAPGSWAPMSVGDFAAAAAAGHAWVDNPFTKAPAWNATVVGVEDVAGPREARRKGDVAEGEAARACQVTAGRLLSIDGIVHRECRTPTVHIAAKRHAGPGPDHIVGSVRLAWSLGDIDMFTSHDPSRSISATPVSDYLAGLDRIVDLPDGSTEVGPMRTTSLGFPLGDHDALRRLAIDAMDGFSRIRTYDWRRPHWDLDLASFERVDPVAFPATPFPILAALSVHARVAGTTWEEVREVDWATDAEVARATHALQRIADTGTRFHQRKPRSQYVVFLDERKRDEVEVQGARILAGHALEALELRATIGNDDHEDLSAFAP